MKIVHVCVLVMLVGKLVCAVEENPKVDTNVAEIPTNMDTLEKSTTPPPSLTSGVRSQKQKQKRNNEGSMQAVQYTLP